MIVWCVFFQIVTNMAYDIQLLSSFRVKSGASGKYGWKAVLYRLSLGSKSSVACSLAY